MDVVLFPPGRERPKRTAEEFRTATGEEEGIELGDDLLGLGGDIDLGAETEAEPEAEAEPEEAAEPAPKAKASREAEGREEGPRREEAPGREEGPGEEGREEAAARPEKKPAKPEKKHPARPAAKASPRSRRRRSSPRRDDTRDPPGDPRRVRPQGHRPAVQDALHGVRRRLRARRRDAAARGTERALRRGPAAQGTALAAGVRGRQGPLPDLAEAEAAVADLRRRALRRLRHPERARAPWSPARG